MIKVNGLGVSRIPINGKETLRIMKNGKQLWSGTGLPNGYTLLEYIESTGTQYIDTGFKPNQNTRIILDYENVGSSFVGLCGSQSGTNTNSFLFYINSTTVYPQYGTHSLSTYQININTKTRLIYDLSSSGIRVGNNNLPVNVSSFSSGYNIALFSINIGGSIDSRMSTGKIYSCKIYDNGVLVRDFVPVKGMISGTYGLYDKVNKVFYGSASGTPFTGA